MYLLFGTTPCAWSEVLCTYYSAHNFLVFLKCMSSTFSTLIGQFHRHIFTLIGSQDNVARYVWSYKNNKKCLSGMSDENAFEYMLNVFLVLMLAVLIASVCTFSIIGAMNGYVYLVELACFSLKKMYRRFSYPAAKIVPVSIATETTLPTNSICTVLPTNDVVPIS